MLICFDCKGKGRIFISCCTGEQVEEEIARCPSCKENAVEETCPTCKGIGKVEMENQIVYVH